MVKLYDLKRVCTVHTVINKIRKPFVIMCDYTGVDNEMGNLPQRQPSFCWADADKVLLN